MTGDAKFFLRSGVSRGGSVARVGKGRDICLGFVLYVSHPFMLSASQSPRSVFRAVFHRGLTC